MWDRKVESGFPELKVLVSPVLSASSARILIPRLCRSNASEMYFNLENLWDILTRKVEANGDRTCSR